MRMEKEVPLFCRCFKQPLGWYCVRSLNTNDEELVMEEQSVDTAVHLAKNFS